jgi:16S rRNA (guanine966-N2)-methyltransferase
VLEGARVLDLFAGTGAIGIEALSRGAKEAVFVEADHAAADTVKTNLAITGLAGGSVVRDDVVRFLNSYASRPGARSEPFDIAFADPPYKFDDWQNLLSALRAERAVLESTAPIAPGPRWVLTASRRYGGTVVTFLRHAGND